MILPRSREPNDPKEQEVRMTFSELHAEVCRFANVLKAKGVKRVIVWLYICLWCLNLPLECWPCARIALFTL